MKYGLNMPAFGDYADPETLVEVAQQAEVAGWDGFFIWDHVFFDPSFHPMLDPMIGLAAVATNTRTMRIGTMITPLARRRPWKVAREVVTLERLSQGRFTLGVGLGDPVQWDFGFFQEETDARLRAEKLDESLDILNGLWTGEKFAYRGKHYQIDEVIFQPRPVQQPRVPIWVGGNVGKPRPMQRAARYDGYFPLKWGGIITPDDWRGLIATIQAQRTTNDTHDQPFDFVHGGVSSGDAVKDRAVLEPLAEAGVTWWVESVDPWGAGISWELPWSPQHTDVMRKRVLQGPPNVI